MNLIELLNEPDANAALSAAEAVRQKIETAIADFQAGKFDLAVQRAKEAAEAASPITLWLQKLGG